MTARAAPLDWGRHYLMCPPDHFRVDYRINPWMDPTRPVDRDRAAAQWENLVATLERVGATVECLAPHPALPDMVFTANLGLVDGTTFVPARMAHPQRADEPTCAAAWFTAHGWRVTPLPHDVVFEGLGDALPFNDTLVAGWSARSEAAAPAALQRAFHRRVLPLELRDPRYYHADLVFCPLDTRHALIASHALTRRDRETLARLVPEPLWLHADEAERMVANSVVVGRSVVMSACPPRVGRTLEAWGFTPVEVDVSEFHLAGGSVSCLALALDTTLTNPSDAHAAERPGDATAVVQPSAAAAG